MCGTVMSCEQVSVTCRVDLVALLRKNKATGEMLAREQKAGLVALLRSKNPIVAYIFFY